jgi:hypothetical protein
MEWWSGGDTHHSQQVRVDTAVAGWLLPVETLLGRCSSFGSSRAASELKSCPEIIEVVVIVDLPFIEGYSDRVTDMREPSWKPMDQHI